MDHPEFNHGVPRSYKRVTPVEQFSPEPRPIIKRPRRQYRMWEAFGIPPRQITDSLKGTLTKWPKAGRSTTAKQLAQRRNGTRSFSLKAP